MLLIYEVTSATDAKNYYASSVAMSAKPSRQDYYSEGQESPGRFDGKLAEKLGIAGKVVDKKCFDRLCDNLHPTGSGKLTPRTNDNRRVCYDFTFSGPKSFSIIEAFASDDERKRLRNAFDESIDETVAEDIEPDMQARERRGKADHDITTGNVLTAGFDHATARPLPGQVSDPHKHKHLLIWNATLTPDRRIVAGQFGNIVRDKAYYEAAFYSRLADKLDAMGYAIDRRGGKEWEIAGVPQSLIDKFSKRTDQIDTEAEKRGITDAARKAKLGAEIRARKQKDLTMPELRKAWDAQMSDGERDALAAVYRRDIASGPERTAAEAVTFAIAHLAEERSVWPERDVNRVAMLHGLGDVTAEQIAAELPRHGVIVRDMDGRRMATTEALQDEENFIVGFAAGGRGTVLPIGVPDGLNRTLPDGKRLNDGQWEIVQGLLDSSNRVNLVEGPAGAGKSWSLQKYDEAMRWAGEHVTYLGTTTDSVEVLQKDGFKVNTVAHFLLDEKMQKAARGNRVVVDESSMLGHADAMRLVTVAKAYDLKLIFVGDPMQHGSIARGATMRVLKDYGGIKPFRLTEIMRQEDTDYLAAAKLLSEGKAAEGFDALDTKGWVREIGDDNKRYTAMAAEYLQALKDKKTVLLVSPTHAEAGKITQEIRSQLREAGLLGTEEREFTRLVAVKTSEPERGLATTYRVGDVLQFHQNAKGFKKGERFTVTDPAKVPLSQAARFSLHRPENIALSVGDRIRGTGTVKTLDGKHTFKNGSTATIAGFTAKGIKLDNGWIIPADAGHFRQGFVETSIGSQGRTVQRVILGMAAASLGATNMQQMYVSSTRAKQRLTLYTDDKAVVRTGIQRSSQKLAALDLRPPTPQPKATRWERVRQHMARVRRLASVNRVRSAWNAPNRPQPERPGPGEGNRRTQPERARDEQQQHGMSHGR